MQNKADLNSIWCIIFDPIKKALFFVTPKIAFVRQTALFWLKLKRTIRVRESSVENNSHNYTPSPTKGSPRILLKTFLYESVNSASLEVYLERKIPNQLFFGKTARILRTSRIATHTVTLRSSSWLLAKASKKRVWSIDRCETKWSRAPVRRKNP